MTTASKIKLKRLAIGLLIISGLVEPSILFEQAISITNPLLATLIELIIPFHLP